MTNTRRHIWNFFLRVRAWPSTGPWYIKYRFRLSKAAFYVCLQSPRFMREIVIFGMWFYKWSKSILWLICYHSETCKACPCTIVHTQGVIPCKNVQHGICTLLHVVVLKTKIPGKWAHGTTLLWQSQSSTTAASMSCSQNISVVLQKIQNISKPAFHNPIQSGFF